MKNQLPAQLLDKYFAGNSTEQEMAIIQAWYASFEHLPDDVSTLPADEQRLFKAMMWENITGNIKDAENTGVIILGKKRFNLKPVVYWLSGVAAVLLVVFFIKLKPSPVNHTSSIESNQTLVFGNTTNAIRPVMLSDGSRVWLSPKSTLTYLKKFEKLSRKVSLTGEAFFEVTKDHSRPFSISTGKVITKVWGTSFRIRAYPEDKTTRVDVITGKVSVSITGQSKPNSVTKTMAPGISEVMLLPDQEAVYDKELENLQKNAGIKDVSVSMWKKANLSFNNTPIREVFRALNKSFKVNISSKDESINSDNLKADFTNENLPTIMEILKKTLNVNYRVDGTQFVLESNK